MKHKFTVPLLFSLLLFSFTSHSQTSTDVTLSDATLLDCIEFALHHQAAYQQALIDGEINERDVRIALSAWLPKVTADANLQRNVKLPVSIFPTGEVKIGVKNTSALQLSATQTLYSNDILLAGKTARSYRVQAEQNTESYKIDLIVGVSKGYYDVLLSQQQLKVLSEAIVRLERNLKDSYSQYENGLTDKIDYKRATISLNNARVDLKNTQESVKVKYAALRQLIGYPVDQTLSLSYDTLQMANEVVIDTTETVNYEDRIEYKTLMTRKIIQEANVDYYKYGYIPSLSAFGNYNIVYQNNSFPELYDRRFPNSAIGLRLSVPLLEGGKRWQNVKKADLQYKRIEWDIINLKNQINTQYVQALATYKSSLAQLKATQENEAIAREVYTVVKLQYNEGIKTYLDVIQSETDLRTAQVNNLNALFQVLSGKLDVQQSRGVVTINN